MDVNVMEGRNMEACTRPLRAPVKQQGSSTENQVQVQIISDELAGLLKKSKENSLQHQKALQAQFTESQEFISNNLDEIQAALAKFVETVTDARVSHWRRESHRLLRMGRRSVDTLQKFCDDIEQ